MLIGLWIVAWLLLTGCYRAKAKLSPKAQPALAAVLQLATEVLLVFVVVSSLVIAIAWCALLIDAPDTWLDHLWKMERTLAMVRAWAGYLRVPSAIATGVLIACALLVYRQPDSRASSAYTWFSRYRTVTKRLVLVVAALASFSVFGGSVEGTRARIEARLRSAVEEYQTYRRELEESSQYAAVGAILQRIAAEHPPSWDVVRDREETIALQVAQLDVLMRSLRDYAEFAPQPLPFSKGWRPSAERPQPSSGRESDGGMPPSPDAEPSREESRPETVGDDTGGIDDVRPQGAGEFSEESLRSVREALGAYRQRVIRELAELLSTPLGQKLPASLLELMTSHQNWDVLRALADEYPLLGAVVGVLEKAAVEALAAGIRSTVAASASGAAADVADLEMRLRQAAAESAPAVVLKWAAVEPLVSRDNERTRVDLAEMERSVRAATIALEEETRRIRLEEFQLRRSLAERWEREGSEFDRDFGFSFFQRPPGVPPPETVVHRDGRILLTSILARIAAESDWRMRRRLLTELATVMAGPESYERRAERLSEIAREPERRRVLEQFRRNEQLSGLPEGTFSSWFENPSERSERLERDSANKERIAQEVRREMDALRARERRIFEERWDVVFDATTGAYRSKPLRIGPIKIPAAPGRALRMLGRVRRR